MNSYFFSGWIAENKLATFLSVCLFAFVVSTIVLSAQKSTLQEKLSNCESQVSVFVTLHVSMFKAFNIFVNTISDYIGIFSQQGTTTTPAAPTENPSSNTEATTTNPTKPTLGESELLL